MSDIFISYNRQDMPIAERLAGLLEKEGWSVWWDPKILPGRQYRTVISEELDSANCVLVLWTSNSVASHWVIEEAETGLKGGKLIPILIEPVEIPMGFRGIEAADLCGVSEYPSHPEFINLLHSVREKLAFAPIPGSGLFRNPPNVSGKPRLLGLGLEQPPTGFKPFIGSGRLALNSDWNDLTKSAQAPSREEIPNLTSGVIYEDHFDDNRDAWSEQRDHQSIIMRVRNGKYTINHKRKYGFWSTWKSIHIDPDRDFVIEAVVTHKYSTSGSDKANLPFYGLLWGGSERNDRYEVQFSYDGYFCYRRFIKDEAQEIIPWQSCHQFKQIDLSSELRASNRIQISRKGGVLEFRLNDAWVEDADFEAFFGDNIGFSVYREFEIEIESIKISQA